MINIKAISVNIGKALLVSALFMALSIGVSLLYGRDTGFGPLMISFIIILGMKIRHLFLRMVYYLVKNKIKLD